MHLNISINTDKICKVVIQDNTKYVPENNHGYVGDGFKYSETTSIAVLLDIKLNKSAIIKNIVFGNHSSRLLTIPVDVDGHFIIYYIVLPNKEWFLRNSQNPFDSLLGSYDIVYYTDGNQIYKYIAGEISEVQIDEILRVNPEGTTISRIEQDLVSICFLHKCYINLCLQIFNERGFSPCWNKNKIDSELVYKRDLVWMAINVIEYLTKLHSESNPTLQEVERIIELILGCNGLCKSNESYVKSDSGCGCSK